MASSGLALKYMTLGKDYIKLEQTWDDTKLNKTSTKSVLKYRFIIIIYTTICWIQEADMAIAGITITSKRATAVDFTKPYHIEPMTVGIKLTTNKWLYFVKPLHVYVYLAFALTPLLISLVIVSLENWLSIFLPIGYESQLKRAWYLLFNFTQKIITHGKVVAVIVIKMKLK